MNNRKIIFTLLLLTVFSISFLNQTANASDEQTLIFDIESPVSISIKADLGQLINNREIIQIPAKIVVIAENIEHNFEGSIEVRGNFRRAAENCDFPPLRLLFSQTDIERTIFDGNMNVKLVTHCKENSSRFIQYMGKEYTTYKLYNLLSPYSLKVKMVDITYIDDKDQLKTMNNQAFIIEDVNHLAAHYNMKEFEGKLSADDIQKENLLQLSVFQFMIGNTDWIIPLSKNLKFIRDDDRTLAVPYDFDYTALVDPDYSIGGGYSILSTPVRKYKGPCYEIDELEAEFVRLKGKKEELLDIISESPYLKRKSKSTMKNYITEFFTIIESREKVADYFQYICK